MSKKDREGMSKRVGVPRETTPLRTAGSLDLDRCDCGCRAFGGVLSHLSTVAKGGLRTARRGPHSPECAAQFHG